MIVGSGAIARRHFRVASALDGVVCGLLDSKDHPAADEVGADTVFSDIDAALAWPPDAAIVAVPASKHVAVAQQLVNHGVHVLIEKPVSDSLHGIADLERAANQQKVIVAVGYNLRFDPILCAVHSQLRNHALGNILFARASVGQYLPDWRPGRDYRTTATARRATGGGALLELSHELDLLMWLVDSAVAEVSCIADRLTELEIETEDFAEITLRFESNTVAQIHLDLWQKPPERAGHVIGELGAIRWDLIGRTALKIDREGTITNLLPDNQPGSISETYRAEVACFVDSVRRQTPPAVDLAAGARVLRIVLAALQSSQSRRAVKV